MRMNPIARILALATCMLYLLGMVGLDPIHHLGHAHDHAEHHTLEVEADACHRAIFHGDLSLGCEHKSHIHEHHVDCDLCDVITNRVDHINPESSEVLFLFDKADFEGHYQLSLPSNFWNVKSGRGPPGV